MLNFICHCQASMKNNTHSSHGQNSKFFFSSLSSVSSRFISFLDFFDVSQYATELPAFQPTTFSSFSNTEHHIQKWFMDIKQVFSYPRGERKTNLTALSAILFNKIKTSCARMTKIRNMQTS